MLLLKSKKNDTVLKSRVSTVHVARLKVNLRVILVSTCGATSSLDPHEYTALRLDPEVELNIDIFCLTQFRGAAATIKIYELEACYAKVKVSTTTT